MAALTTAISFQERATMPCQTRPSAFQDWGAKARQNFAVALFSFPTVEAYDEYRREVAADEGCKAATTRFHETQCFSGYERTFLVPMFD
jgi:hypothetical protein